MAHFLRCISHSSAWANMRDAPSVTEQLFPILRLQDEEADAANPLLVQAPWEEVEALEKEAGAAAKSAAAAAGTKYAATRHCEGAAATVAPLWNMGEA